MISAKRLNSASCAHRSTCICRQLAGYAVRNSYRKGGHELFDFPLAKGTVYMAILVHDQFVKGVFTAFAVIFKDWHFNPPYSLGIRTNIITQESHGKGDGGLRISDCGFWI